MGSPNGFWRSLYKIRRTLNTGSTLELYRNRLILSNPLFILLGIFFQRIIDRSIGNSWLHIHVMLLGDMGGFMG